MAETRTWLTTPEGGTPADDAEAGEYWVRGPRVPDEPRLPSRFRGALGLLLVLGVVVGLTFAIASLVLDGQDPTFGQQPVDASTDG